MEKPRERAINHGIKSLSNAELISILLRTGKKGKNVMEVSEAMLKKFGDSLLEMQRARVEELSEIKGVGIAKALTIQAALEIGYRMWNESMREKKIVKSAEDVYNLCEDMTLLGVETVRVIVLDSQLGMITTRDITVGTATASLVHPREIFNVAVKYPASGIILVHNHPSGSPKPSEEDLKVTERVKKAGSIMGIKLLDHVIVASGGYYSFAQEKNM